MNGTARKLLVFLIGLTWCAAQPAWSADAASDEDQLAKDVKQLKRDVGKLKRQTLGKWLKISGDYRFRVDNLKADVKSHADAMGFFNNMAGDLLTRASDPTNTLEYNPVGVTDFFLTADPSERMNKVFNFFPAAMANNISMSNPAFMGASMLQAVDGMTPAEVAGMLQMTALTTQQAAILGSLLTPDMFAAVAALVPADGTQDVALGGIMGDPDKMQLFQQMVAQGLLGDPDNYPSSYVNPTGDYSVKNSTLFTHRFSLNLDAKPTKYVSFHSRFRMYKVSGSGTDDATTGNFFADRVGVFDGTQGHTPSANYLNVDRAYVTWNNMFDLPMWFSVGRRPSTDGAPGQVREYGGAPGSGGVPSLLVDYAFDGLTFGVAPDWEILPGFFAKLCYGRGFESGLDSDLDDNLKDTDMIGIGIVPIDTTALRIDLQWNRGSNIFDFPVMKDTVFGDTMPSVNLGDIDWYGAGALGKASGLTWFATSGLSVTHPNDKTSFNAGMQGLLTGDFFAPDTDPDDKTGWAVYLGGRYDFKSTGTSIGGEYNRGSKNWITFVPAADDMWTAKLGTRGNVYEVYLVQDMMLEPVSSLLSKVFIRIGYQYYDFEYTGSNNWVGAPKKISDLNETDLALLAPVESATNIYGTIEVRF